MKHIVFAALSCIAAPFACAQHPIKFDVKVLTVDSNEGCTVADFDNDGKLDVSAGRNWFRNGDWLPRPVRLIEDREGYVRSNGEWAFDVNGDGNVDIVSMDFVQEGVYWYENPGGQSLAIGEMWPQHLLSNTGLLTNETSYLVDLDGDDRPEWISDQWKKTNPLIAWSFEVETRQIDVTKGKKTETIDREMPVLKEHLIGTSTGHGIGFGDINNDGRLDILVGTGWYEGPDSNPLQNRWRFHQAWQIQGACPMIVYDVDGDGRNDVLASNAHDFGISLWRNAGVDGSGEVKFEESLIDDSYSQAHCLHLADLDGDGVPELVTGKRVRAHNGRDPGGTEPPIVKYYVWNANAKKYDAHVIRQGDVGIGLQIRTGDIDSDGDLDIVLAGKEGTQILFSRLK